MIDAGRGGGIYMKNLKGRKVLVTGGAQGIGFAVAECFAGEGADVFIGDIRVEKAEEAAKTLEEKYGTASKAYKLDVSSREGIRSCFERYKEEQQVLDILINNAGIQIRRPSLEFEEEKWDLLMNINLKGTFYCAQEAAGMMKDRGGAIVNISSGTSTETLPGRAPYCISKAGINGMTAVLAAEWAKYNIRVNAVAPGWILTQLLLDGMNMGIVSEKQILAAVPMKRLADVREIAGPVVYLASDEASYVTGQTLFVDGGQNALGLPDM